MAAVLRSCRSLCESRSFHHLLLTNSASSFSLHSVFLQNLLIQTYVRHGSAEDACYVFSSMLLRDRFSWSFMMRAHVRHDSPHLAFHLYRQMLCEGLLADDPNVVSAVLLSCSRSEYVSAGKHIHACICHDELESDLIICNGLISMYGNNEFLESAECVFQRLNDRDVVTWTAMFAAYAHRGRKEDAFFLFDRMKLEGIAGDNFTLTSVLSACINPSELRRGKYMHASVCDLSIAAVDNALLKMYTKCGSVEDAEQMFQHMACRNEIAYATMINCYVGCGDRDSCFQLFHLMQTAGFQIHKVSYISILLSCSSKDSLSIAKRLHTYIIHESFESDIIVETSLVSMYGRCGDAENARKAFDKIIQRNIFAWNAMITAYVAAKCIKYANQLYAQMLQEAAIPDKITFINMTSAYTSDAHLNDGEKIHTLIIGSACEWDVSLGNALLNMYGKCGQLVKVQDILYGMPEWDIITLMNALCACADPKALSLGRYIHACILVTGCNSHVGLMNALMNMYCKCGSLLEAWKVFDTEPEHDCISWSIIISANVQYGHEKQALHLFGKMEKQGAMNDKVTFLSVLCACGKLTTEIDGKYLHTLITSANLEHDIEVKNALIDMYRKCGALAEARKMFDMELEKDLILWTSIISAYAQQGERKQAASLFLQMQKEGVVANATTLSTLLFAWTGHEVTDSLSIHAQIVGYVGASLTSDVVLGTTLINFFGRYGNLGDALKAFNSISSQTLISCNAMIMVYAQHGQGVSAMQLMRKMGAQGLEPDGVTLVGLLSACSHSGFVCEVGYLVQCMQVNEIAANLDHYNCIFDLFKRIGRLDLMSNLSMIIPFQPCSLSWMTLVGGCEYWTDITTQDAILNYMLELG